MDSGLNLSPIPPEQRTASFQDVLLLFAGANIVSTTLVTGGSLAASFSMAEALVLIAVGIVVGTAPIGLLAALGPRYGLPSMVLLRHPFGHGGAATISLLLVVTNFAWIALNNVIAAEAMAPLLEGPTWVWNLAVGTVAVAIALVGPRAMVLFDRGAIPLMMVLGVLLTLALFGEAGREAMSRPVTRSIGFLAGLDVVVGYQISWSLMFADYTRYQKSERRASGAAFLGLALSSAWLMAVGAGAGIVVGGNSPTEMIFGLGLPLGALALVALSTITTNFVNIYLASLALRNLWPKAPERPTVILVGVIGTLLGIVSPRLLDHYAEFMGWIATLLLPIVGVVAVHFFLRVSRQADPRQAPRLRLSAVAAWLAGVLTYQSLHRLAPAIGATLPTVVVTASSYYLLSAGWVRQRQA